MIYWKSAARYTVIGLALGIMICAYCVSFLSWKLWLTACRIGWGDSSIFAKYGPFHNQQRKMYNEAFGKNAVAEYRAVQEREANILLKGLLDDPNDFDRLASRYPGFQLRRA